MANSKASNSRIVSNQYFKIKIKGDQIALQAYSELIAQEYKKKSPVFAATARGYRPSLRMAGVDINNFIENKLWTMNNMQPIRAIRDIDGWIFFGAI